MAPDRPFLLFSSSAAAGAGLGALAIALAARSYGLGLPGGVSLALVACGFVALAAGLYGVVTWAALAYNGESERLLALAHGYEAAGKPHYALTFYEEALRTGADPDYVEERVSAIVARLGRA